MQELEESEEEAEPEVGALHREIPMVPPEEVHEQTSNPHPKLDNLVTDFVTSAMQLENLIMLSSPTICLGVAVFPPMAGQPSRPA